MVDPVALVAHACAGGSQASLACRPPADSEVCSYSESLAGEGLVSYSLFLYILFNKLPYKKPSYSLDDSLHKSIYFLLCETTTSDVHRRLSTLQFVHNNLATRKVCPISSKELKNNIKLI